MTERQFILTTVQGMPEEACLGEILDELRMLSSVKQGLAETERV